MSFDVYFQPFSAGLVAERGHDAVVDVLAPFLRPSSAAPQWIEHPSGRADVYGLADGDSMMVDDVERVDGLWNLLVDAARAGRWTIMPIGCPTFVLDDQMLHDLPEELQADAIVISSGVEALALLSAR